MKKVCLLLLLITQIMLSCGEQSEEFSAIRCFVSINNQEHNDATLASAMQNMSPGIFCIIQQSNENGVRYFSFQNNLNNQSRSVFNGKEQRMNMVFGYNNGIIVGFGNMDSPPTFYAYDLQCPNCFNFHTIPRHDYPLQLSSTGIASCPRCYREYNMNTGGNIVQGNNGNKLTRYRASTTGAFGVLSVN